MTIRGLFTKPSILIPFFRYSKKSGAFVRSSPTPLSFYQSPFLQSMFNFSLSILIKILKLAAGVKAKIDQRFYRGLEIRVNFRPISISGPFRNVDKYSSMPGRADDFRVATSPAKRKNPSLRVLCASRDPPRGGGERAVNISHHWFSLNRAITFFSRSSIIDVSAAPSVTGPELFHPLIRAFSLFRLNCSRLVTSDSQANSFCTICLSAAVKSLSVSKDFPLEVLIIMPCLPFLSN
jgi:hypothetical protein